MLAPCLDSWWSQAWFMWLWFYGRACTMFYFFYVPCVSKMDRTSCGSVNRALLELDHNSGTVDTTWGFKQFEAYPFDHHIEKLDMTWRISGGQTICLGFIIASIYVHISVLISFTIILHCYIQLFHSYSSTPSITITPVNLRSSKLQLQ